MADRGLKVASGDKLEHKWGPESRCLIKVVWIFIKVGVIQEKGLCKVFSISIFIMRHKINDDGDGGGAEIAPPLRETLISLKSSL